MSSFAKLPMTVGVEFLRTCAANHSRKLFDEYTAPMYLSPIMEMTDIWVRYNSYDRMGPGLTMSMCLSGIP